MGMLIISHSSITLKVLLTFTGQDVLPIKALFLDFMKSYCLGVYFSPYFLINDFSLEEYIRLNERSIDGVIEKYSLPLMICVPLDFF